MVCGSGITSLRRPAAHSCCACAVAGEPGGRCVSRRGVAGRCAAGGGRGSAERNGGGQRRVCRRRAAVGLRCPGDSQNVVVGTIAHQFDERITPSQQNNGGRHK
jgi:hypothetical protein